MIKANNYDEYSKIASKINSISDCVNAGQCKGFTRAEFIPSYPAAWHFVGADGSHIAIYALDAITDTGNGYRIDYREYDIDSGERLLKTLCLTFL